MMASKLAARPVGPDRTAVSHRKRQSLTKRRGCGEVARRRAARYATRRRIPKALWPLIAAAILVWLIFDRRPPSPFVWAGGIPDTDGDAIRSAAMAEPDDGRAFIDRAADPSDTGSANNGIPQPKHLPPYGFLAEDVAQVVAFLLRNRGRLDNEAIRAKWAIVDRISLPLPPQRRGWLLAAALRVFSTPPAIPAKGLPQGLRRGPLGFASGRKSPSPFARDTSPAPGVHLGVRFRSFGRFMLEKSKT